MHLCTKTVVLVVKRAKLYASSGFRSRKNKRPSCTRLILALKKQYWYCTQVVLVRIRHGGDSHPEMSSSPGSVGLARAHPRTKTQSMEPSRQTWSSYGPPYPLGRWSSDWRGVQREATQECGNFVQSLLKRFFFQHFLFQRLSIQKFLSSCTFFSVGGPNTAYLG